VFFFLDVVGLCSRMVVRVSMLLMSVVIWLVLRCFSFGVRVLVVA